MSDHETLIWKGPPSHLRDLGFHVVCWLLSPLVVPIFLSLWRFLETRAHLFELTSERIQVTQGVLSKRMEEVELYRVKDSSLEEPFLLRLFGLGHIRLATSDPSAPRLLIGPLADARGVRENLRGAIEKARERKRVREVDYT